MQLHSLLLLPGDAPAPLSRVQEHLAYIGEPWSILNPLLQFSVGDPSWKCCFVPLCEQGVGKPLAGALLVPRIAWHSPTNGNYNRRKVLLHLQLPQQSC